VDQGAGQAQLLLHAAREIARQALPERGQVGKTKQAFFQRFALVPRHFVQVSIEAQVFLHRKVAIQAEALRHVTDAGLDLFFAALDRETRHRGRALAGGQDAGQEAHGGGLAGAIRADQAEDFAAPHFEVEPAHRPHFPESAAQAIGLNGNIAHLISPCAAKRASRTGLWPITATISGSK
jgi:hypothetical protein